METKKQRVFSGIRPTGGLHIGNYLGSIKQWVDLQGQGNNCVFAVVDYHALTTHQENISKNSIELAKWVIASGVDPEKSPIILQSQIPVHTELAWIFACLEPLGELYRMTQFKEKSGDEQEGSTKTGLLTYPLLMASDILLYQTDIVPVGEDQKQHVELCRDIAKKFNHKFGEVFTIPKVTLAQMPRVMSLKNPGKKMSKTGGDGIALSDSPEQIKQKIMSAVTDTAPSGEMSRGVKNLFMLLKTFAPELQNKFEKEYANKTIKYSDLKQELGDAIAKHLQPIQAKYRQISDEKVKKIFSASAEKVLPLAEKTLLKVKKAVGILWKN